MNKKLVLIHTVPQLLDFFEELCAKRLPDVQTMHVLDEPLLDRVRQRGGLAAEDSQHLQRNVEVAAQVGADAVLVTCSTISPCVDDVRSTVEIPIVKIDEAMIVRAVNEGGTLGVVATNPTTLTPTQQMLQAEAAKVGQTIETVPMLVEDAFEALRKKDFATHDRLVKNGMLELSSQVDQILLAQASTARVLEVIREDERLVPILSSPDMALTQIEQLFELLVDRGHIGENRPGRV